MGYYNMSVVIDELITIHACFWFFFASMWVGTLVSSCHTSGYVALFFEERYRGVTNLCSMFSMSLQGLDTTGVTMSIVIVVCRRCSPSSSFFFFNEISKGYFRKMRCEIQEKGHSGFKWKGWKRDPLGDQCFFFTFRGVGKFWGETQYFVKKGEGGE